MIVFCPDCLYLFDDQFRLTMCPHNTFLANDGDNQFSYHNDSCLHRVTIEEMIKGLNEAGWTKKFGYVWKSPAGRLVYGPVQAFRVMKSQERRII